MTYPRPVTPPSKLAKMANRLLRDPWATSDERAIAMAVVEDIAVRHFALEPATTRGISTPTPTREPTREELVADARRVLDNPDSGPGDRALAKSVIEYFMRQDALGRNELGGPTGNTHGRQKLPSLDQPIERESVKRLLPELQPGGLQGEEKRKLDEGMRMPDDDTPQFLRNEMGELLVRNVGPRKAAQLAKKHGSEIVFRSTTRAR